jgi:NhaA family Na+:H+ antiporter
MKPKYDPKRFLYQIQEGVENIKSAFKKDENIILNDALRSRVQALGTGFNLVQAPAQILENKLHLSTSYLVIPIFALANAGVPIDFANIGDVLTHPVAMGIGLGLVFGKLIGIAGFTWVAVKLGVSELPKGLNMTHIIGVSFMGGIGFTMSIFIAELGFVNYPKELLMAKTGILFASLTAGIIGFTWLYLATKNQLSSSDEQALSPKESHH